MNAIANVAESAQNVWHGRSGRALRERERCRAGALLSRQRADTLFSLGPKRGARPARHAAPGRAGRTGACDAASALVAHGRCCAKQITGRSACQPAEVDAVAGRLDGRRNLLV